MTAIIWGWRKKIGVVTLLIACMFMVAWVTSFSIVDEIFIPHGGFAYEVVLSVEGSIRWKSAKDLRGTKNVRSTWMRRPINGEGNYDYAEDPNIKFFLCSFGFALGEYQASAVLPASVTKTIVIVPYWSVVLPLALLSAYLLLTKPRTSTPIQVPEPVSTERGMRHE